jgi:uncharacterized protein YdaU (DUF1376 family)
MTTSKPWMPLYIADYRADTAHLSAAEHGAYLLLIMHYWQTGGLPKEDAPLARIACMSASEWRKVRPTIAAFFNDDWSHKRVDEEIAAAAEISESNSRKARGAANKRWAKHKPGTGQAMLVACSEHPPSNAPECTLHTSPSLPNGKGVPPSNPKKEFFDRGKAILGSSAGGFLSKLLRSYGDEDDPIAIAKARARIEDASTKANPAEWLGRVLAKPAASERADMGAII